MNLKIKPIMACILVLTLIFFTSCVSMFYRGDFVGSNHSQVDEDLGLRGLEEIPFGFWSDFKSVSVDIMMDKNIHAEHAGSLAGQAKAKVAHGAHTAGTVTHAVGPMMGVMFNPILFMFVPLAVSIATGAVAHDSPEFHKDINNTVSIFSCTKKEFLLDLLKQRLSFPSQIQLSYKMRPYEASKEQEDYDDETENDVYIIIFASFTMQADPNLSGSEPKAKLVASASASVASKGAMERQTAFFQKFSLPLKKNERMSFLEQRRFISEMRREKILQGTYQGNVIKKTEFFEHSRWLSDNGIFLEESMKELLQKSILELSQKIGNVGIP